jgi:hypothetical protein
VLARVGKASLGRGRRQGGSLRIPHEPSRIGKDARQRSERGSADDRYVRGNVNLIADFGSCRDANKAIDRRVVPDRHEMRPPDLRKIADDYIISVKF